MGDLESGERAWRSAVALIVLLVVLVTMGIDHLVGNEGDGGDEASLVDPAFFAISVLLSLAVGAVLFGWLVPRERRKGPERAARTGLVSSILSVVPGLLFVWVGIPFVLAGCGVALGIDGRHGARRAEGTAAVVVGGLVLILGTVDYLVAGLTTRL